MIEYQIIKDIYGTTCAKRTGVPYMNHIDEGLMVLDNINANGVAKRAFCLHPLLQVNEFASKFLNHKDISKVCKHSIVVSSMYANSANAYLCKPHTDSYSKQDIVKATGLIERNEVMDMLLADKVQNYKDFIAYHYGKHPRSSELDNYFKSWINFLAPYYGYNSGEDAYNDLIQVIEVNS